MIAAFWLVAMSDHASKIQDGSLNTLGGLLYTDRSDGLVPESDWVLLVYSIAGGDRQALRVLYERTHRLVFTLAMRITSNRESAEEVTLDVFRDVWLRSGEYQPAGGPVVGWIMNQARSRAIDRLRFEQRKKRVRPDRSEYEATADERPESAMDVQRQRQLLQAALVTLTPDERQTIETAFFSELTYAETAARLNQPLGTVKTRVRAALAKLRKALASEGGQQ
jgi:RNA polymerase sigma-70 factor, ECF subfamily